MFELTLKWCFLFCSLIALNKYTKNYASDHYGGKSGDYKTGHDAKVYTRNRGYGYEKHYMYDKEYSTSKHGGTEHGHHSYYGDHKKDQKYVLDAHKNYGHKKYGNKYGHDDHSLGKYDHLVDNHGEHYAKSYHNDHGGGKLIGMPVAVHTTGYEHATPIVTSSYGSYPSSHTEYIPMTGGGGGGHGSGLGSGYGVDTYGGALGHGTGALGHSGGSGGSLYSTDDGHSSFNDGLHYDDGHSSDGLYLSSASDSNPSASSSSSPSPSSTIGDELLKKAVASAKGHIIPTKLSSSSALAYEPIGMSGTDSSPVATSSSSSSSNGNNGNNSPSTYARISAVHATPAVINTSTGEHYYSS